MSCASSGPCGPLSTPAAAESHTHEPTWTCFDINCSSSSDSPDASSTAAEDAEAAAVLHCATQAHGQGRPVLINLQQRTISSRRHPKAWQLLLDLLARAGGHPCKLTQGALSAHSSTEAPRVNQMRISGYCYMQGLRLAFSGPLSHRASDCQTLLQVSGSLILSDSEIEYRPHSAGSMAGRTSKHGSRTAAKVPSPSPVTSTCLAVAVEGPSAALSMVNTRVNGFDRGLRVEGGAKAEVLGCHFKLSKTSPGGTIQAADKGTFLDMRGGSLSATCMTHRPLVLVTKLATALMEGMELTSLWPGLRPDPLRMGMQVVSGAQVVMKKCILALQLHPEGPQAAESTMARVLREQQMHSNVAMHLGTSTSADLSGCSITGGKVCVEGSQLKALDCTLAGGLGPALLISSRSGMATMEDCKISSTGMAAVRFTSPKEKGKRSEGKEGAPSACKLAMCDITGPICIDATGSVAVDVDSCSLTAQQAQPTGPGCCCLRMGKGARAKLSKSILCAQGTGASEVHILKAAGPAHLSLGSSILLTVALSPGTKGRCMLIEGDVRVEAEGCLLSASKSYDSPDNDDGIGFVGMALSSGSSRILPSVSMSGCELTGFLAAAVLHHDVKRVNSDRAPLQLERCALHNNIRHVCVLSDGSSSSAGRGSKGASPVVTKGCYMETMLCEMPGLVADDEEEDKAGPLLLKVKSVGAEVSTPEEALGRAVGTVPGLPWGDLEVPSGSSGSGSAAGQTALARTRRPGGAEAHASLQAAAAGSSKPEASEGPPGRKPKACGACGSAPAPTTRLQACSRCRGVRYCGEACQKAHWPQHKAVCSQLKQQRGAACTEQG